VFRIYGYRDPEVAAATGVVPSTVLYSRKALTADEVAWLALNYDLPHPFHGDPDWSVSKWLLSGPYARRGAA
jgi:hypothetical protein